MNRRHILKLLGTGGFGSIAGCGQQSDNQTPTETTTKTPPSGSPETTYPATPSATPDQSAELSLAEQTVRPLEVQAVDPIFIATTIRNTGANPGEITLPLRVNGSELRSRSVRVPPGESSQVEFAFRPPTPGMYDVGIGTQSTEITVIEPVDALPHFAKPAAQLSTAPVASRRDRTLVNSLQGIVNARQPRIFFEVSTDWADTPGINLRREEFGELIESYSDEVTGFVVYDPNNPHTLNAATTIAGSERALLAAPDQVSRLREIGLDIIYDFREHDFETASPIKLYEWAMDEYWERTADRVLVGLPPTRNGPTEPAWQFRDYAVAVKAMTVWLDPTDEDEASLISEITSRMSTPGVYLGWWPDEVRGVATASENGVFTGAADFLDSGTYWSGTAPQNNAPWPDRLMNPEPPDLKDIVYVTFTITEGDNLQYCQNRLKEIWDDPDRGRYPINWSVSPLLAEMAPGILSYYFETATENDHFMCGPNGMGYAYPKDWPTEEFGAFTKLTGRYLEELNIETLYALNRLGIDSSLSSETVNAYERDTALSGIALGWDGPETSLRGEDLVVSHGLGGIGGGRSAEDIKSEVVESVPGGWSNDRPLFRSVGLFGFEMGPSDVVAIADKLDDDYEIVRGDVFFELARESFET